jgi:Flp pilus assembly protein TadG
VTHRRQPASTGTSTPGRAAPSAAAHERGGHRERGQATVELALLLPLVALLLLALVQVAVVARDQVLVVHAAREAARAAAVDPDVDAARQAAEQAGPLAADRLTVEVTGRGEAGSRVRVVVSYIVPLRLPLLGAALGDVTLSSSATMRVER